ncbi:Uncharacterised protein [Raoultella terrigena]|uniref:Uncharacterized protein n=1 Tax=Raoultella terrigena TaxID=577 RepID=A0A7Z8ZDP4_RAOTE|nr:Uncharacterised protein [Raoultella terrigena]
MEQLRTELSHLLGEKLSRVECVSEKPLTALWALYDAQGNPLPLLARSFTRPALRASWRGRYQPWPAAAPCVCRWSTA